MSGDLNPTQEELRILADEWDQVRGWTRWLWPNNPVRQMASRILAGDATPEDSLEPLLASLSQPAALKWRERALAAWSLGRLNPAHPHRGAALSTLMGVLGRKPAGLIGCSCALGCIPYIWFPYAVLAALKEGRLNRVRTEAAASLGLLRSPLSVGLLADVVCSKPASPGAGRVRRVAWAALGQALQSLTPNHYGRLESFVVPRLCRALNEASEPLGLAILDGLAKIGDGRALNPVRDFARRGHTKVLRERSLAVIPILEARMRRERESWTLLRAADAPDAPSEVLLRPAGQLESKAELLLRPSSHEAE